MTAEEERDLTDLYLVRRMKDFPYPATPETAIRELRRGIAAGEHLPTDRRLT